MKWHWNGILWNLEVLWLHCLIILTNNKVHSIFYHRTYPIGFWLLFKILPVGKKHDLFCMFLLFPPLPVPAKGKSNDVLSFCPDVSTFGTSQTYFRFLLGKYYNFWNALVTIVRIVYLHLLHRTQAREEDNTLQICWFCKGRYVFCLGLLQLHWVMDFHSDQKLDPLHLQDKNNIKC